ncbi:MAG: sugar phosphate isomerase/epimerase family protein [Acidobacteriota bacterium]|jgi:sugar phosphate isomerase/epimerase|nr:sugar phosphate isomerase/epimerase [Bryobacteraceae bacterium CoA2 C42]
MSDWAIGLSTGCFWQTSIFDCLEPIRNSGFDRLEICSHPAHLDYHHRDTVRRARQRIHELGLEAYSFHAPFAPAIDITSLDESSRDFAMAELIEAAEAAALLEVRYLVLHPGPENSILPEHERFVRLQNAVEVLNRFYHHCRRLGIGLVLENMLPHLFAGRTRDLMWILGALDVDKVGICLDTGHAYLAEDLLLVVHKLSGHLWMVHASDNRRHRDDHLPPGAGDIDWAALLAHLTKLHFNGTMILEISGDPNPAVTLERARGGRQHLRDLAHRFRANR